MISTTTSLKFINICILFVSVMVLANCTTEVPPIYELQASSEPAEAGSVSPQSVKTEKGTPVQITAKPNEHWQFVGWSGDISESSDPTINVTLESDLNLTALFERVEYPVNIDITGNGDIKTEVISQKTVSEEHRYETVLKITAEPDYGWEFVEWGGDLSGNELEKEVEITGPLNATALFERVDFKLTVQIEGGGEVEQEIVQAKTIETDYPFETMVQLTAVPDFGWNFERWSGDLNETDPVIVVEMDENQQLTANFVRQNFTLSIVTTGEGSVTKRLNGSTTGQTTFPFESRVEVIATPATGWSFMGWSGDASGTQRTTTVDMESNKSVQADFSPEINITTSPISNITQTTAGGGGNLINEANLTIIDKGVCWSTSPDTNPATNPNIDCVSAGTQNGSFSVQLTNLKPSTRYYVRAAVEYEYNSQRTRVLGNERQFTTLDPIELPTVATNSVSSITQTSAQSGGNITDNGGATVTTRGICWSTQSQPDDVNGSCSASGSGNGNFSISMTGLSPETQYYVRAYATNSAGTAYGSSRSFTTQQAPQIELPTLSTLAVTSITTTSAVTGGSITSDGGATVTNRGVCISTAQNPTTQNSCTSDGTGTGSYSSTIGNLSEGTTYYVRAFAQNSQGVAYGNQLSFTTTTTPTQPPPTTPPPTSPPPASSTQIALVFMDGVHFDVTLNGTLIPSSRGFDYTFGSAGVKVVTVSGNITSMALNPNQIKVSGLNNEGFGFFGYKMVNKNSDANLYAINNNNNGNPEFWGQPASTNPLGVINNRSGDTVYGTSYPDSLFYLGWRFDPVNQPNNRTFESQWSNTGKMAITFSNYGQNHPNPAVP